MPLTDVQARNAKREDKPYKLSDGRGLYLLVTQVGKYWRFNYRYGNKQKTLAIGAYSDVKLVDARAKLDDARKLLANDIDPAVHKKAVKHAKLERTANSFESVALEWVSKKSPSWTPAHANKILRRFERDAFPWIGGLPVRGVTAPQLLPVLRRVEGRGAIETAHRLLQDCGQVLRYAISTNRAERDPSADLRGALAPINAKHHPSITNPTKIGELLRAIDGYEGSFITRCALLVAPLLFVRPGELRNAEWSEFDLTSLEWRIPAEKMKMRSPHIVPLSSQAISILRNLYPLTSSGRYVFPGARTNGRPMSENTINAALKRLGYGKEDMTGHGFRSMASTLLNEQGWNRDAIERQLAHSERDGVRAAYNYAEYLPERKKMMQHWGDYLDKLRAGADVISLRGKFTV